jgi:hypothetical protein
MSKKEDEMTRQIESLKLALQKAHTDCEIIKGIIIVEALRDLGVDV